mgnify:CR=1 FL=1
MQSREIILEDYNTGHEAIKIFKGFGEWQDVPVGFLEQIVEYRCYARAYQLLEAATTREARDALRGDPMVDLAERIMFELAAKDSAERRARAERQLREVQRRAAAAAPPPKRRRRRR